MSAYLLDTNHIIFLLNGNSAVQARSDALADAIEANATLVTDEQALLVGDIPGLAVENWHAL